MSQEIIKDESPKIDALSEDWLDVRLVSAMRLMLAASALWVIYLDPGRTAKNIELIYVVLVLYTFYSTFFYLFSLRWATLIPAEVMPWIDVICYLVLLTLTSGTSSIFFSFIFFPILVASFGWGYSAGLYLTLFSAFLLTLIPIFSPQHGPAIENTWLMLRPIQLLILGYLISRWGGFRVNLRKRLQLLKELTVLSNPRFGIDRTVSGILESLRSFYDAEACLLLIPGQNTKSHQLYRTRRGQFANGASSEIGVDAAAMFLSTPNYQVVHCKSGRKSFGFDLRTRQVTRVATSAVDRIAGALETTSYLSVPLPVRNNATGRLFVVGAPRRFDKSQLDFLLQLTDHLMPLVENIRLVDNLATEAADEERRRIGHDIHDSVIQPYLGLQLGIAAVARKVQTADGDVLASLEELLDLTNQELIELRRYVRDLRDGGEKRDALLPAINRFVNRFASMTGINVEVETSGKVEVSDRLAGELFQIVAEGLSNVRRHALCNHARIEIGCEKGNVLLYIKNRRSTDIASLSFDAANNGSEAALFTPRSISDRVALLGGRTEVTSDKNNYTVVSVSIPI